MRRINVVGASVECNNTEVLLDDGSVQVLPSEVLLDAIPHGHNIKEYVVNNAPIISVCAQGAEVLEITLIVDVEPVVMEPRCSVWVHWTFSEVLFRNMLVICVGSIPNFL